MLTEDLPQLLQSLLVSVEQIINRVSLDELNLTKTWLENGSSKRSIKRREIITKNDLPQNRYTLRRMSMRNNPDNKLERKDIDRLSTPKNTINNTMPLFCLGGSFPHIDSDEDSAQDDGTESPSERKSVIFIHKFQSIII